MGSGGPGVGRGEAPGGTALTTRSSAEREASRGSPVLRCATSQAASWSMRSVWSGTVARSAPRRAPGHRARPTGNWPCAGSARASTSSPTMLRPARGLAVLPRGRAEPRAPGRNARLRSRGGDHGEGERPAGLVGVAVVARCRIDHVEPPGTTRPQHRSPASGWRLENLAARVDHPPVRRLHLIAHQVDRAGAVRIRPGALSGCLVEPNPQERSALPASWWCSSGQTVDGEASGDMPLAVGNPTPRPRTSRPVSDRAYRGGIFRASRCRKTVCERHRFWSAGGAWGWILRAVQADAGLADRVDWSTVGVGSTSCRVHQYAAGTPGRSRASRQRTTPRHHRTEEGSDGPGAAWPAGSTAPVKAHADLGPSCSHPASGVMHRR